MNARLCIGLLLGFVVGFALRSYSPPHDVQAQGQPSVWEYKAAHFRSGDYGGIQKSLKQLGIGGWEYVGILNPGDESSPHSSVAFRRPRARSASALRHETPVGGD